jgi:ferrous iron transport protein B
LMTCSARLPVYTLLIAAFVPRRAYLGGLISLQGLTLSSLYLLGIVAAVAVALVLRWTVLRGLAPPLLMEIPPYEWPSPRLVLLRVVERGWLFVRTAGTVILAVSILVWAALYYPHSPGADAGCLDQGEAIARLPAARGTAPAFGGYPSHLENGSGRNPAAAQFGHRSLLARLGRAIEPAVRPLGWDWRIGSAVLASFPQREAVVATLGVIFSRPECSGDNPGDAASLAARLREATWEGTDRPLFTLPVALSILVFYALCVQCVATLAVIRRETGTWRWPAFTFAYLTGLAYLGSLITYQLGTWIAA